MSTTNFENFVRPLGSQQKLDQVAIDATNFPFNKGDTLYFDTSAKIAKPSTSDANNQYLLGVAAIASGQSLYVNQYTGTATTLASGSGLFGFGDVYSFKTYTGDTFTDGLAVYWSTDAQTVTTTGGSYPIGYVSLPEGGSVTGAAGVRVNVLVNRRYPFASL